MRVSKLSQMMCAAAVALVAACSGGESHEVVGRDSARGASGSGGGAAGASGGTGGSAGAAGASGGTGGSAGAGGVERKEDADSGDPCFAPWQKPSSQTAATSRPSPTDFPAVTFRFSYSVSDAGQAIIVLHEIRGTSVVRPSDGPFSVDTNSGTWVELRNAANQTLYTRGVSQLVPEAQEVFGGPDGSMGWVPICPKSGSILGLDSFPNDPNATDVVFFQEPVDGVATNKAVEFARFHLP